MFLKCHCFGYTQDKAEAKAPAPSIGSGPAPSTGSRQALSAVEGLKNPYKNVLQAAFDVLAGMDTEAVQLARAFFVEPALARRLKVAEQLADRVLGVRGFFEWESVPDNLEGEK